MKIILMLLILLLSLSCFSQENDRAMILKNKVKSERIVGKGRLTHKGTFNCDLPDTGKGYILQIYDTTFIEYNKNGQITKSISSSLLYSGYKEKNIYFYRDTLLVMKIKSFENKSSDKYIDTCFYEYDNKGRVLSEYKPEVKESNKSTISSDGSLFLYDYSDSVTNRIGKVKIYTSNNLFCKNSCSLKYKDGHIYYLLEYDLYNYVPTQIEPIIYIFREKITDKGLHSGQFINTEVDGVKSRIWDTLYKYENRYSKSDTSILSKRYYCDENIEVGKAFGVLKSELKVIKNDKLFKVVAETKEYNPSVEWLWFKYYDNGLIKSKERNFSVGVSSQYDKPYLKTLENYEYLYEYYK